MQKIDHIGVEGFDHLVFGGTIKYRVAQATLQTVEAFDDNLHFLSHLFQINPSCMDILITAYEKGEYAKHDSFKTIVADCIYDESKYLRCSKLIFSKTGIILQDYTPRKNYTLLQQQSRQIFFDALFNRKEILVMLDELIKKANDPDITIGQLNNKNIELDRYSPLRKLMFSIRYTLNKRVKVKNYFKHINWEIYSITQITKLLKNKNNLDVGKHHVDYLKKLVDKYIQHGVFDDAVKKSDGENCSINSFALSILFLVVHFNFSIDIEATLKITEFPSALFKNEHGMEKYEYLQDHLTEYELSQQISKNLKNDKICHFTIEDHIKFCGENNDSMATAKALSLCMEGNYSTLNCVALEYLYSQYGCEYIIKHVLYNASDDFLIEIANVCKDMPIDKLRKAMEIEYSKKTSSSLQAYLIKFGSEKAMNDYIIQVRNDKKPPSTKGYDPTEAISEVHYPTFIPLLCELTNILFDPEFIDKEVFGLHHSLTNAFLNSGNEAPDESIQSLQCILAKENILEGEFRFCNYLIERIKSHQYQKCDVKYTVDEIKKILFEHTKLI